MDPNGGDAVGEGSRLSVAGYCPKCCAVASPPPIVPTRGKRTIGAGPTSSISWRCTLIRKLCRVTINAAARMSCRCSLVLALVLTSCFWSHSRGPIVDGDGNGAFTLDPNSNWGVGVSHAKVGETWSAGSVTLCKKPSERTVTLQSIEPISVTGQVRLDGIGVRHAFYLGPNQESTANKVPHRRYARRSPWLA